MMKLESQPPYPITITLNGHPTKRLKSRMPSGLWQAARTRPDGHCDVLWEEPDQQECDNFLNRQADKDYPGLRAKAE
jgi:hypothetical protein